MPEDTPTDAAEAFALLGDQTRVEILRALGTRAPENFGERGLRFSELRTAVGVDDAGRFNYHLDKLRGHLVRHEDEEYKLTPAGRAVVNSILAGAYAPPEVDRTAATDLACIVCDGPLTAGYDDGVVDLACDEHGKIFTYPMPPGVQRGRDMPDVLELANLAVFHHVELGLRGACADCWGAITATTPATLPEDADPSEDDEYVYTEFECDRCKASFYLPTSICALVDASVVAFYDDHGVDLRRELLVDVDLAAPDAASVVDEDPVRVRATATVDDERLAVTFDGDSQVVAVDRTPVDAQGEELAAE
jgi:DNA-binding transcriptional ArsR family regulator